MSASLGVWQHIDANFAADPAADHHSDDQGMTASDAHDADDEDKAASDDHDADDEDKAPTGTSLLDVVTGSVDHAPVPAALAIAWVGLALGLATIGLGGAQRPS